jgi:tripartite-type tricarboxylate transporter receptor subunit TctC
MTSLTRRLALLGALGAAPVHAIAQAQAQTQAPARDWPARTVHFIIPFAAGGATDTLSRLYCAQMGELTGKIFVTENKIGAAGIVGTDAIAKAAADGYTIGLGSIAIHAIAANLYARLPFDTGRDFTMIAGLWQMPNMLVINNDVPATNLAELVALIRKKPDAFSYGSAGTGTTLHLTGSMLGQAIGVEMTHVPYRGTPQALLDLSAGRVQLMFDNIPSAMAYARSGKARAIAVTSAQRNPAAPDIPTMAETLPGFELMTWNMLVGPAGMPKPIVSQISAMTRRAIENPAMVKSLAEMGAVAWWTSPEDATAYRAAQEAMFAPIVRASGARVE